MIHNTTLLYFSRLFSKTGLFWFYVSPNQTNQTHKAMKILEQNINKPYYIVEASTGIVIGFYDTKSSALAVVEDNKGYLVKRRYQETEQLTLKLDSDTHYTLKY